MILYKMAKLAEAKKMESLKKEAAKQGEKQDLSQEKIEQTTEWTFEYIKKEIKPAVDTDDAEKMFIRR